MSAATALLSLSIMNNLSMEREREERERLLKMRKEMTMEELENEFQYRKNKMNEISRIFTNIRNMLAPLEGKETLLGNVYQDLKQSMNQFEATLVSEAAAAGEKNDQPLVTAQKLENTVREALDTTNAQEDKTKSVTDFRDYARNAKHSTATKCAIGAVIGGLATVGLIVGMLGAGGALSLVFGGPIGFTLFSVGMFSLLTACGALMGVRFGLASSKNQDDTRGRDVCKNLQTLVAERNRFFQEKKYSQPEPIVEAKDRVVENKLRYSGSG